MRKKCPTSSGPTSSLDKAAARSSTGPDKQTRGGIRKMIIRSIVCNGNSADLPVAEVQTMSDKLPGRNWTRLKDFCENAVGRRTRLHLDRQIYIRKTEPSTKKWMRRAPHWQSGGTRVPCTSRAPFWLREPVTRQGARKVNRQNAGVCRLVS